MRCRHLQHRTVPRCRWCTVLRMHAGSCGHGAWLWLALVVGARLGGDLEVDLRGLLVILGVAGRRERVPRVRAVRAAVVARAFASGRYGSQREAVCPTAQQRARRRLIVGQEHEQVAVGAPGALIGRDGRLDLEFVEPFELVEAELVLGLRHGPKGAEPCRARGRQEPPLAPRGQRRRHVAPPRHRLGAARLLLPDDHERAGRVVPDGCALEPPHVAGREQLDGVGRAHERAATAAVHRAPHALCKYLSARVAERRAQVRHRTARAELMPTGRCERAAASLVEAYRARLRDGGAGCGGAAAARRRRKPIRR